MNMAVNIFARVNLCVWKGEAAIATRHVLMSEDNVAGQRSLIVI